MAASPTTRRTRRKQAPPAAYTPLRLRHHQHSGKLLAHAHTSYRTLALLLGVVGIGLLCIGKVASASTYTVTATVPANLPNTPPTITMPLDGSIFAAMPIPVNGSCPVTSPALAIVVYAGSFVLGSTACQNDGTYSLEVSASPGTISLTAQTMSLTNQLGPVSQPVSITYNPPQEPQPPTPPRVPDTKPVAIGRPVSEPAIPLAPLEFKAGEPLIIFTPGKSFEWAAGLSGGTAPFTVTIDWGDGTVSTYTAASADEPLKLNHAYGDIRAYSVLVTVTDSAGQIIKQSFSAVTPSIQSIPFTGGSLTPTPSPVQTPYLGNAIPVTPQTIAIAAYGGLVATVGTIWLQGQLVSHAASASLHGGFFLLGWRRHKRKKRTRD